MIWLPDDGPRTETCRSVCDVLMCKFYKFYVCAVVGIIIEQSMSTSITRLTLSHTEAWFFYVGTVTCSRVTWRLGVKPEAI